MSRVGLVFKIPPGWRTLTLPTIAPLPETANTPSGVPVARPRPSGHPMKTQETGIRRAAGKLTAACAGEADGMRGFAC